MISKWRNTKPAGSHIYIKYINKIYRTVFFFSLLFAQAFFGSNPCRGPRRLHIYIYRDGGERVEHGACSPDAMLLDAGSGDEAVGGGVPLAVAL